MALKASLHRCEGFWGHPIIVSARSILHLPHSVWNIDQKIKCLMQMEHIRLSRLSYVPLGEMNDWSIQLKSEKAEMQLML